MTVKLKRSPVLSHCNSALDGLSLHCAKTLDGTTDSDGRRGVEHVSTSSNGLLAGLALPDSGRLPLDVGLSAEGARVLAVLSDFDLLHELTEGSSVADSVLSGNSNLLRAFSHCFLFWSKSKASEEREVAAGLELVKKGGRMEKA